MKLIGLIPKFDIVSESLKTNNPTSHDIDENTPNKINCQNYTVDEFSNLDRNLNSFDLFHSNVNGLSSHFDDLHEVLTNSAIDFNVICISETTQQKDEVFPLNETFVNFDSFYTSTYCRKK